MDVKKVCILGAGTMGNQLTQLAALSGYQVTMVDIEDKFIQNGLSAIKGNLKKFFVDKAKMTQEEADKVFARISGTADLKKAVEGVQVVIECIPEEMDLKQKMFKRLDEACPPETILASNTSSLSITSIGSLTKRPDKIIGMHFFNPVAVMRLVEIIRSAKTSDETYEAIKAMSVKLGKEVVTVKKDVAGFIVSRLFVMFCNEAVKIMEEGVATPEDIDKACQLGLGHAAGPFKSQDMVDGIPVSLHCMEYFREELGDSYRPHPLWRRKVLANELGIKTRKGFYDYTQK